MAEIEFKRRGTPLWVVLLALIVIALVVWFFVARRTPQPAPGSVTMTIPPAPAPTAAPGAPTAAGPTAGAATPLAIYSSFVDSLPKGAAAGNAATVSEGLRRLADALVQQYPANGVQVNVVRAMSDSLRIPDIAPKRQTDMAQAAFFAAAYAMGRGGAGDSVSMAATQVALDRTLSQQADAVRSVFVHARNAMTKPPAPKAAPSSAPQTAPAAGAPAAGAPKKP